VQGKEGKGEGEEEVAERGGGGAEGVGGLGGAVV
jgi:hypothetical protein